MVTDVAPLVRDKWPDLAAELVSALREEGEDDLARQVATIRVVEQCGCGDDVCRSFYTAPKPDGAYGPGHRNVGLSPSKPGYLILDVVDDVVMYVEVLHRPPLT